MPDPLIDMNVYVGKIEEEGARVAGVARLGPLDARVPHMPRWRISDVVAHLGGVHRWAAEIVMRGTMSVSRRRGRDTGDELVAWFDDGVAQLVKVLAATRLDEPCPNFSPGTPSTMLFWARRQAHETAMHRWDAESAVDATTPFVPLFASDGIDELFHTFTHSRGGQILAAPIAVATTDTGHCWRLSPAEKEGRVEVGRSDADSADVAAVLSGPAEDLLLALWKRRPIGDLDIRVSGEAPMVDAFVAGPVSP